MRGTIGCFSEQDVLLCEQHILLPEVSANLRPAGGQLNFEVCLEQVDRLVLVWQARLVRQAACAQQDVAVLGAAMCVILGELLENAFKYRSGGGVQISTGLLPDTWICLVGSQLAAGEAPVLRRLLRRLLVQPSSHLLSTQAELNCLRPGHGQSKLGYLTLLHDYGVSLGWRLSSLSTELLWFEVMARLPLQRDASS